MRAQGRLESVRQIPRADRGEDSASIRRGIVFHDLITQAVDGDPSAVLDGVLHLIPPEERADFESMFTTHLALLESERLTQEAEGVGRIDLPPR